MKTLAIYRIIPVLVFLLLNSIVKPVDAQHQVNILDQGISLYIEDEPLESVIQKICDQFNLNFDYNSKLIKGKRVNLSISNKSVKEVLERLMEDYYLIFEIQDNLLMVRDYIPYSRKIDFEQLYRTPSTGFLFDKPNRKSVRIDFKLISNLIVIPLSINGSDTMNFILDTGIRDPIITELTMVEKLNLNYLNAIEIKGLGSETITQAYQSGNNTIKLPGLTTSQQKINVVLDENFQISQILGMPVHGLIGINLFKHYIVTVDYHSEEIKLTKPQDFNYKPRKNDIVLPLTFVRNKPIVKAEIVQDDGSVVPVSLLIDTGASDALWLSTQIDSSINIPEKNIYAFLGAGLSGDLFGYKGRLSSFWIGGLVLPSPIVSYPESSYINSIIASEQRHGSIGGEILRRFTITFDYYNNRIIMRPNGNIREKFHYNMSGLEIINPVPGLPVFTVNNVMKDSPAWEAGIRKSDQIISLNYNSNNELTLNDINLALRQRDNKRIKMTLLRNGEMVSTQFYLTETF